MYIRTYVNAYTCVIECNMMCARVCVCVYVCMHVMCMHACVMSECMWIQCSIPYAVLEVEPVVSVAIAWWVPAIQKQLLDIVILACIGGCLQHTHCNASHTCTYYMRLWQYTWRHGFNTIHEYIDDQILGWHRHVPLSPTPNHIHTCVYKHNDCELVWYTSMWYWDLSNKYFEFK